MTPIENYTEWRGQEPQASALDQSALALVLPPWGATYPTTIHTLVWTPWRLTVSREEEQ